MASDPGAKFTYWKVLEPHWTSASIYDGPERFRREFIAIPEVPRQLFAAHWCVAEVCNGGFGQFFDNSTGVLAPEAIVAFRKLGLHRLAGVVQRAVEVFPEPYPRDRDERQAALDRVLGGEDASDPFEGLDGEFFRLLDTEAGGFDRVATSYASSHLGPGVD